MGEPLIGFHQESVLLSEATGNHLVEMWEATEAGGLDPETFRVLVPAVVARANSKAVALADLGLTAETSRYFRRPIQPLGLQPTKTQVDQTRIARDVERIFNTGGSATEKFYRLGRSETLLTVAAAMQVGLVLRGVKGWTRQLIGTSCDLCVGWADGVVRRPTTRMARHLGCDCLPNPVF